MRETATTTGTGDFTLAGAVTGFVTANTQYGLNVPFDYCIEAVDANSVPTGQWETGVGYLSGTTTLVRSRVYDGSSGVGTLVNFSAGSKIVFNTIAGAQVTGLGRLQARMMGLAYP